MKRIIAYPIAVLLFIVCAPIVLGATEEPSGVFVNGVQLSTASPPVIAERQPHIRAEDLAMIIGASITWNAARSQAVLNVAQGELILTVGDETANLNGEAIPLGSAPFAAEGAMMVPLQALGEPLGYKAIWDALTSSLFIYKKGAANPKEWVEQHQKPAPVQVKGGGAGTEAPHALVKLDGDAVTIFHDADAVPKHFYLNDGAPYRIVVDFPAASLQRDKAAGSAVFSGEIVSQGAGLIGKVRYAQFDPQTVRFVIELNRHADYSIAPAAGGTRVSVRTAAAKYKIVIDAGHGGKDPGANGYSGRFEKHFTLELARKVYDRMLQDPELAPLMTRTDDSFVELEDRAKFANEAQADLFISIHGNTYESAISGTETYYYSSRGRAFGEVMHRHVTEATQLNDRGLRESPFKVLKLTKMPAVLLELGYLSTQSDEQKMLSAEFQDRVAAAIVAGAKEYLQKTK
jgi:N-acetylmuramoyl-L-alanine amidase